MVRYVLIGFGRQVMRDEKLCIAVVLAESGDVERLSFDSVFEAYRFPRCVRTVDEFTFLLQGIETRRLCVLPRTSGFQCKPNV